MAPFRILHRRESVRFSKSARSKASAPRAVSPPRQEQGSALLEFALVLPLLVVLVVGIYDFSGAFNQKQKIAQAAQEGAIIAGAQPMSDIASPTAPVSLQPVVSAIFNSLVGSGVLPTGCTPLGTTTGPIGLAWTYTISGCADNLVIVVNRGWVPTSGSPRSVGTIVQVTYPYHWRFGSAIQLLFPGPNGYLAPTPVTASATVHNQM